MYNLSITSSHGFVSEHYPKSPHINVELWSQQVALLMGMGNPRSARFGRTWEPGFVVNYKRHRICDELRCECKKLSMDIDAKESITQWGHSKEISMRGHWYVVLGKRSRICGHFVWGEDYWVWQTQCPSSIREWKNFLYINVHVAPY